MGGRAGVHGMGEKEDVEVVLLEKKKRGRNKVFNAGVAFSGV
jgi:hypothetical protein